MSSSLSHDSAATSTVEDSAVPLPDEAAKTTTSGTMEAVPRDEPTAQQVEEGSLAMGAAVSLDRRSVDSPQSPTEIKPTVKISKMEALEIDIEENTSKTRANENIDSPSIANNKCQDEFDDDLDRANADMEGLLSSSSPGGRNNGSSNNSKNNKRFQTKRVTRRPKTSSSSTTTLPCAKCCMSVERHGNCVVFWPSLFAKTGWGIMGPHWFGPPCVAAIILSASSYFIRHALVRVGPITAGICAMFTVMNIYFLVNTCYRNPGIVMPAADDDDGAPSAQHRWCDFCKAYQPPSGAHCPDCNCCILGYDHHCVWMGTCIGKKNFKPFVRFNLSWLMHLAYAVFWVSIIGPILYRNKDTAQ